MIVTGDDNMAIGLSRGNYYEQIKAYHGQNPSVEMFDSMSEPASEFMARAMTATLFQEIRLYCVLHTQSLSVKDLTAINKALDYEIPDVYIFISAESEKKGAAAGETNVSKVLQLKKRADDESVSIKECTKPRDYEIAKWLVEHLPSMLNNRYIGMAEAEYLAEMVDYDLIYSELQKIDLALEPGARIDKGIIQEIVGASRTMTVYELAAALGKRDLPTALNVLDSLFAAGSSFSAPSVAAAVFDRFWSMLKIKRFLNRNPHILRQFNTKGFGKDSPQSMAAYEIGVAAGMLTDKTRGRVFPVIIKSGIVQQAQSFSEQGLREILGILQRFDVEVKTGKTEPVPCHLQMLCYRIARAA